MENYLDISVIKKLFEFQKTEFENQIIEKDKALKEADLNERVLFNKISNYLKDILSEKEFENVSKIIDDYELAKFEHEDIMFYLFYQLGLADGIHFKK